MKYPVLFCCLSVMLFPFCKPPAEVSMPASAPMTVVSFNSICCGVRSDDFLKSFFERFKSENSTKLYAVKVTACGKEGEYKILFATGNLPAGLKDRFMEQLQSVVEKEVNDNKGDQLGTVEIAVRSGVDVSHCRGKEENF